MARSRLPRLLTSTTTIQPPRASPSRACSRRRAHRDCSADESLADPPPAPPAPHAGAPPAGAGDPARARAARVAAVRVPRRGRAPGSAGAPRRVPDLGGRARAGRGARPAPRTRRDYPVSPAPKPVADRVAVHLTPNAFAVNGVGG